MSAPERTDTLVDGHGEAAPRDAQERGLAGLVVALRADPPRASAELRARVRVDVAAATAEGADAAGMAGAAHRLRPRLPPLRFPQGAGRTGGLVVATLAALALAVGLGTQVLGEGPDGAPPAVLVEAPRAEDGASVPETGMRAGEARADADRLGSAPFPAESAPMESGSAAPAGGLGGLDPTRPQNVSARTSVRVADAQALTSALSDAMSATTALGGFTATLEQGASSAQRARAELTVRVPVNRVEEALRRFAGLGTLVAQRAQIVDLGERIAGDDAAARALEERIADLRDDLAADPGSTRLRAELRQARADLAAVIEGRQRALEEARLATLTLTLTTAETEAAVPPPPGRFERALRSGGDALGAVAAGVLEGAVVLSPLLALGLAVLAWRAGRRRADRRLLTS